MDQMGLHGDDGLGQHHFSQQHHHSNHTGSIHQQLFHSGHDDGSASNPGTLSPSTFMSAGVAADDFDMDLGVFKHSSTALSMHMDGGPSQQQNSQGGSFIEEVHQPGIHHHHGRPSPSPSLFPQQTHHQYASASFMHVGDPATADPSMLHAAGSFFGYDPSSSSTGNPGKAAGLDLDPTDPFATSRGGGGGPLDAAMDTQTSTSSSHGGAYPPHPQLKFHPATMSFSDISMFRNMSPAANASNPRSTAAAAAAARRTSIGFGMPGIARSGGNPPPSFAPNPVGDASAAAAAAAAAALGIAGYAPPSQNPNVHHHHHHPSFLSQSMPAHLPSDGGFSQLQARNLQQHLLQQKQQQQQQQQQGQQGQVKQSPRMAAGATNASQGGSQSPSAGSGSPSMIPRGPLAGTAPPSAAAAAAASRAAASVSSVAARRQKFQLQAQTAGSAGVPPGPASAPGTGMETSLDLGGLRAGAVGAFVKSEGTPAGDLEDWTGPLSAASTATTATALGVLASPLGTPSELPSHASRFLRHHPSGSLNTSYTPPLPSPLDAHHHGGPGGSTAGGYPLLTPPATSLSSAASSFGLSSSPSSNNGAAAAAAAAAQRHRSGSMGSVSGGKRGAAAAAAVVGPARMASASTAATTGSASTSPASSGGGAGVAAPATTTATGRPKKKSVAGTAAAAGAGGAGGTSRSSLGDGDLDDDSKLGQDLLDEKRRRRRESHNAVERRRRDNINEKIHELATLLPDFAADAQNKGSILRRSVEYIKMMQALATRQHERMQELENCIRGLLMRTGLGEQDLMLTVPLGTVFELPSSGPPPAAGAAGADELVGKKLPGLDALDMEMGE
ncbi:hypothetical protein HDU96_010113 [Phlyctochytrium bullatum]|nr:hypothetical protein HDU96_010113 [Phlyctochytrium bullatum]